MTRTSGPQTQARLTIRLVDIRQGLYTVLSSSGERSYLVSVKHTTCTCPAGQNHFHSCTQDGLCKHLRAAKMLARVIRDRRLAAQTRRRAA